MSRQYMVHSVRHRAEQGREVPPSEHIPRGAASLVYPAAWSDNAVVLDPFMGTGTTIVAAELEGASGIGIEVEPTYVAIARRRLVEAGHVQHTLAGV